MNLLSNTEKRLIVLYSFSLFKTKASKEQISTILVNTTPITWLDAQVSIKECLENRLLEKYGNKLAITTNGEQVIDVYSKDIPNFIKNSLEEYIEANRIDLLREMENLANFKEYENGYLVNLVIKENNDNLLELNLKVSKRETAEKICENWKIDSLSIYRNILKILS